MTTMKKMAKQHKIPKGIQIILNLMKPEDQELYQMVMDKRASLGYDLPESVILKLLLTELKNLRKKDTGGEEKLI